MEKKVGENPGTGSLSELNGDGVKRGLKKKTNAGMRWRTYALRARHFGTHQDTHTQFGLFGLCRRGQWWEGGDRFNRFVVHLFFFMLQWDAASISMARTDQVVLAGLERLLLRRRRWFQLTKRPSPGHRRAANRTLVCSHWALASASNRRVACRA